MAKRDNTRSSGESNRTSSISRRNMMKATAGAGALAMGVGSGIVGSASGALTGFDDLSTTSDNRIVNESDETFKIRGLNIPDPKRLDRTTAVRGKTAEQIVRMLTNNEKDWHPRVLRVPAQPADIGEHPNGHAGPNYFDENGNVNPDAPDLDNYDAIRDSRRAMQPAQPVAFTEQQLQDYLENYYKPIVDQCRERGVYCIIDFHRHWHEQPPGTEDPSAAENHLPYTSEHTNYWAYNTHEEFGEDVPGSWGHVDQKMINELTPGYDGWAGISSESDIPGTPYAEDMWEVNQDLLDEATMFWDAAAEMFADEPHVIFETYNEPTAPGIWGPVEGCGAIKQKGLWQTFLNDFVDPIVDTIRQHAADDLLMIGPMGWCQSVQALHWENFEEHGIDNAAVTWHNYAGHDVSQLDFWLNDTSYESLDEVEAQTGKELEDPFIKPPNSVDEPECWGWEGFHAAGLQNAMDQAPVAVTEFGWIDDPSASHWLRGSTTGQGTTFEYGQPFFEAMESDDRISWVAWCADPRWLPAMFDVPWTIDEGELELTNDNWYDTPDSDIPVKCDNLPCEWNLMGNPNSGEYIKQQLIDHKDDLVPFETESIGGGTTTPQPPEGEPMDPDDDGLYEDYNGDGSTNLADAGDLFQDRNTDQVQNNVDMYDFSGNDEIDLADVVQLFQENTA